MHSRRAPLGEKQENARRELREQFAINVGVGTKVLKKSLQGRSAEDILLAQALLGDAKIDVNEYFAAGNTAAEFETILACSKKSARFEHLNLSSSATGSTPGDLLAPILGELKQLSPLDQDHYIRQIQIQCGKDRMSLTTLREQLKATPNPTTKPEAGLRRICLAAKPRPKELRPCQGFKSTTATSGRLSRMRGALSTALIVTVEAFPLISLPVPTGWTAREIGDW